LRKAGVRLAKVLNDILSEDAAATAR
jgi:hypothetical protein